MLRVVTSPSAVARLDAARRFIARFPPGTELVLVGASRGAADDLARAIACELGATFGLTRFSLTELAARAAVSLAGRRRMPGSQATAEAMAARAVHEAIEADELQYFEPVARTPGFPRALARTLHELRLARVDGSRLRGAAAESGANDDLACLLERVEAELTRAGVDDRAALFSAASAAWSAGDVPWAGAPVVLLDVTLDSPAEQAFVAAIAGATREVLATVPDGDERARAALESIGGAVDAAEDPAPADSDLAHLRRYIFTAERPPERQPSGDVRLFSAPGEGREAVEIVRRLLDEASRGVPFDQMAVFLRAPEQYLGLLEHACARADVPVYFDRGTRRPDPAGRAFVALLTCAVERLSARRFDEYLSLGQVPSIGSRQSAVGSRTSHGPTHKSQVSGPNSQASSPRLEFQVSSPSSEFLVPNSQFPIPQSFPRDEVFTFSGDDAFVHDDPDSAVPPAPPGDSDEEAIVAGTLRSPWKWEELIVESHVVGGTSLVDGRQRWRKRLEGLRNDFQIRIEALRREEPESPRIQRFQRDLRNLRHLEAFALPIVDVMAAWPERDSWSEWIVRFSTLATMALARPDRVLGTVSDLRPMGDIGDVTVEEARDVLRDRLVTLDWDPPARRYGKLFVGTPHQARGRSFAVVFVPGLAERVVPQRPREDPLILDDNRQRTDPTLMRQEDRSGAERLLLKLAIGAAAERVYVSYPRMDVAETRARVPSFYALDVMRAITGRVPDHRVLANDAAEEAGASLAWPAPRDPVRAIDDLEHDLAVLRPLLDARDPASVKGRAHYLLGLNDSLARSVRSRWRRSQRAWASADGLVKVTPGIARAIDKNRLGKRPYSLSALQRFATCPYQFLLATIHRLEPWDEPEPLVRMDPLTRGSLFHEVQAGFYRALQDRGALPVVPAGVADAVRTVEEILERVAADYAERLAPAIERVWNDEIGELRRDLGIWVKRLADDPMWVPKYFEFSFGLQDEGRDPHSLKDPVTIDGRFILRGSVDLIEHRSDLDVFRVTDHKTGKNRTTDDLIVGGGKTLQPVLYSAAIEEGLKKTVASGRLFFCTTAGGFGQRPIAIDDYARRQGIHVLEIVDRSVAEGFLPAAPEKDACRWCDFRPVCGPREEERVCHKAKDRLADLEALRSMR